MSWLAVVTVAAGLTIAGCGGQKEESAAKPTTAKPLPPFPVPAPSRKPGASAKTVGIPPGATVLVINSTLAVNQDAEYVVGEEKGSVFLSDGQLVVTQFVGGVLVDYKITPRG